MQSIAQKSFGPAWHAADRAFLGQQGYFFDVAGMFRTRFTTDCETRNIWAIAGGFMPAE